MLIAQWTSQSNNCSL